MKKILSFLLTGVMALSLSVPAFAAEESKGISSNFVIQEYVDADNRIIRTYSKEDQPVASRSATAPIEDILVALGMEETAVDGLSNDEVESFQDSAKITSVTSYIKVDKNQNMTYLSEEDALREVAEAKAGGMVQDKLEDNYMRVWHAASYLGNATYQMTTDARWLTMPFFRNKDAVGANAQFLTVTPNTLNSYYSYDYIKTTGMNTSSGSSGNIAIKDYDTAIKGNFFGCVVYVNLPDDYGTGTTTHTYSNFFVHMSYKGHLNFPQTTNRFNSIGTYIHIHQVLDFTPSLSIDSSGPSASLSLGLKEKEEVREVLLEVQHKP